MSLYLNHSWSFLNFPIVRIIIFTENFLLSSSIVEIMILVRIFLISRNLSCWLEILISLWIFCISRYLGR